LSLLNRFPKKQSILPVYGLIIILVYGWSAYWFIWNLPSWLTFLTAGEIIAIGAYALFTNLLESIFVLAFVLILCFCLPAGWLNEGFIFRGAVVVVCLLVYLMLMLSRHVPLAQAGYYGLLTMLVIVLVIQVLGRVRIFRAGVEVLADRSTIFAYITVPSSVIAMFMVLARNVF
jgi:hypothetical protein